MKIQYIVQRARYARTSLSHLLGNYPRDLICLQRHTDSLLPEAEVAADEHERSGDAQPQQEHPEDGGEGHGGGGAFRGEADVENDEQADDAAASEASRVRIV